ncbi:MAG: hypothetical protein JST93_03880 [Acidobacteria bacterium]|nr:hypothetical protein [Acidobacteriota bacterium]
MKLALCALLGAALLPAGLINFDDVSGPVNTRAVQQSNHYSAQGVLIQTILNATDGLQVGDTFTATPRDDGFGVGAFATINAATATSSPNFAVSHHVVCDPTCHAVFASDELLFSFDTPVASASLVTDTANPEAADVVRLIALKRLGGNQYQILAITSGLDNATSFPANQLQVAVDGGFTDLLFETTTEAEGIDNLDFTNVPEPSTISLALLGACAIYSVRRITSAAISNERSRSRCS